MKKLFLLLIPLMMSACTATVRPDGTASVTVDPGIYETRTQRKPMPEIKKHLNPPPDVKLPYNGSFGRRPGISHY